MLGVFAEFERAMISERIKSGLARTRKTLGRPRIAQTKREAVLSLRRANLSVREIARKTGLSVGSVHQLVAPH